MSLGVLPNWTMIGLAAVALSVVGSFFDKYLLEQLFEEDEEEDAGPGALTIFSAGFSAVVATFILLFFGKEISLEPDQFLVGSLVGVLNGAWIFLYLHALNRAEVSRVVPIFQTVPVFGLALGFVFLGEALTQSQMVAAGGIILGALVLFSDKGNSYLTVDTKTLGLMLAASFLLAYSEVLFKVVSEGSSYWSAAFWLFLGFALFGLTLYAFSKTNQLKLGAFLSGRVRKIVAVNSVNETIDGAAELLFFFAITIGPVALVQSLNAYQPLIAFVAATMLSRIFPRLFGDEVSKLTNSQGVFALAIITISSLYLYTQIQP